MTSRKSAITRTPSEFRNKVFLLIGGAGSLGRELVDILVNMDVHAIRILDNSERNLYETKQEFNGNPKLRFLQGDVRDPERLAMAMANVDYVLSLAALKSVDIAVDNPLECISVNLNGNINLIREAYREKPIKTLVVSSDKALLDSEASIYHATKFALEVIMRWADKHSPRTRFACIRPANFVSSSTSVFDTWFDSYKSGEPLAVTDPEMRRYFIPLRKAALKCLDALRIMRGGEVFVPEAKEYQIMDLVKRSGLPYKIVGARKGDRLSEALMTEEEQKRATKKNGMWIIHDA